MPLSYNTRKLVNYIQRQVRNIGLETKVLSSLVIPDYSKLFELENKRADLIANHRMILENRPRFSCLVPSEISDVQVYKAKLKEIDYEIDLLLTQELKPSRTAFVTLDTLASVSFLEEYFRFKPFNTFKDKFLSAKVGASAVLEKLDNINRFVLQRR